MGLIVSTVLDGGEIIELLEDLCLFVIRCPEVSNEVLVLELHLVESLVHGLLSGEEHLEDIHGRGLIDCTLDAIKVLQLLPETLLSFRYQSSSIVNFALALTNGLIDLHLVLGHVKSVTLEGVADLLDSFSLHGTIPEHNDVSRSSFILAFIITLEDLVVHDALTLGGSEDQSLKALELGGVYNTSNACDVGLTLVLKKGGGITLIDLLKGVVWGRHPVLQIGKSLEREVQYFFLIKCLV